MVTFNYNFEENLLHVMFVNKICQSEVVNLINSLYENDELPRNLNIFIDVSNGGLSLNPTELYSILDENIRMFQRYNSLRVGIVTSRPVDTALAIIYTRLIQLERYKFHVFNTTESAIAWLARGLDYNQRIYPVNAFLKRVDL